MRNFFTAASVVFLLLAHQISIGQVIWNSTSGTVWLNGANWTGGSIPGSASVAQFGANPTSSVPGIGIDMDTASGALTVGAISVTSSRTNAIFFGNSSASTTGTLNISGATVSVPNVVLANFSANSSRMTLQNTQGSGGSTMTVDLGSSASKILTGAGGPTSIGNTILVNTALAGTGNINFLGGGTWNASSATGNNGGLLKLGATNTFSGGITVGSSDGSSNGILELDAASAIGNYAGNNITVHPNNQLYLAAASGTTYNTNNLILNLAGFGNNYTSTGRGALVTAASNTYIWSSNINLVSDAAISVLGNTGNATLSGNISGSGQLVKTGPGNLVLSGTGNSWTGGTQINSGKITVNAGSGISNGLLVFAQTTLNGSLVLNNAQQTVSGVSSSFTTTGNNTVTLNGSRLTINQNFDAEFGGPSSSQSSMINGSGSVVKTGTGTLLLSSAGNTFAGGLRISGGRLRFNPNSGTVQTNSSPDTLNGGVLSTDSISRSFTFNFGTLCLTDNSTIELGRDSAHNIKFTASSSITWTSGKTLTITHWMGTYSSTAGTRGRIFAGTNASGLNSSQLSQIRFDDGAGNIYSATQLSTGEIVPAAPVINTNVAGYGPFCNNVSSVISVAFTSVGPFTGTFYVQLSGPSGTFPADFSSNIIGSGASSPLSATIPSGLAAGTAYRVRVINPTPTRTFGRDNLTNIVITGIPSLPSISGASVIVYGGTVTYANAVSGGVWSVTNPLIATVNTSGVVTGVDYGVDTLKYSYTNSCGLTGSTSKTISVVGVPSISSISPAVGIVGSTVLIRGSHFDSIASNNVVYFGATRGTVVSCTSTAITATVPANASYSFVSVTDTAAGITATSPMAFLPTYPNTGLTPNATNFKPKVDFNVGTTPVGVVAGDLNGDGKTDVVVTNSGPNTISIFRNIGTSSLGSSTFASPVSISTASGPHYLRLADLDGDGKPEIIVVNTGTSSNKVSVYRNTCTSSAISFATRVDFASGGNSPIDLAIADFDMDGKPDIAVVNLTAAKIAVLRNLSIPGSITTSSFASAILFSTGTTPFRIFAGDVDGDGYPDMAVTIYDSNAVFIFHNNGTIGSISAATFAAPVSLATGNSPTGLGGADIDGDGKTDLMVTNSAAATMSVYRNTNTTAGSVSFATAVNFATGIAPNDFAIGDIDGNGKPDIALSNYNARTLGVYLNNASTGSITTSSLSAATVFGGGLYPSGIAISDFDGDNKPDLALVNGGANTVSFFKNYPLPSIGNITGVDSFCAGTSTTFRNSVSGGIWTSGNPAIATISSAGVAVAIAPGVATISYMTIAQGDTSIVTHVVTVDPNATVSSIYQPYRSICVGTVAGFTDSLPGGIWSSSDTGIARINSFGYASGMAVGSVIITYSFTNSCGSSSDTAALSVSPSTGYVLGPIVGATTICYGTTTAYTDTSLGGAWSSSNPHIASVSSGGIVTGVASGNAIISYTYDGGCGNFINTRNIHIDTTILIDSFIAPITLCAADTVTVLNNAGAGGTWTITNASASIGATTGFVTGRVAGLDTIRYSKTNTCGTFTGQREISILALPNAGRITGAATVCTTDTIFLVDSVAGGTWRVTNGRAQINTSGRVIGIAAGADTVMYIFSNACGVDTSTKAIAVLSSPSAGSITGPTDVCLGASIQLRCSATGGTWSAANPNATVTADSGVVTGVTVGIDTIRYSVTNMCGTAVSTKAIQIDPYPTVDTIAGPSQVCTGTAIQLTNVTVGGTWSKSNNRANVNASGLVTGISAGKDTIRYTVTFAGCATTVHKDIDVIQLSAGTITAPASVCVGTPATLRETVAGGVWSTTGHASTMADSILSGTGAGTDTIKYTVTNACGSLYTTKRISIVPLPNAGEIAGSNSVAISDTIQLKNPGSDIGAWKIITGNSIVSADGVLAGLKVGLDTVLYISFNSCGRDTAVFAVTITATRSPGVITDVKFSPNPSTGIAQLIIESKVSESVGIVISNTRFQIIKYLTGVTNGPIELDLTNLPNGMYFISAIDTQGWHTLRILIER